MITFDELTRDGVRYLEAHRRCGKHHVEHTGSNCYLLDFYDCLGETEKGKAHIEYLLSLIRPGTKTFYPGHLDPYNMSQNVIDTGSAVDCIARFADRNHEKFTEAEHARIMSALRDVVENYLASAAADKPITNQRLWGLTGVASFARYAGEEEKYRALAHKSIERAFADMTVDGFFRYYPDAQKYGDFAGYDDISEFYQSRHIAFIRYSLENLGMDVAPYDERLQLAERALLAMYKADGIKDMRLECKRWYWLSKYEVAASGFDTYALAHAVAPEAREILHNALYQVRRHFFDGYLHSDLGVPVNFQCPIFWTAHLAWMLRIAGIKNTFNKSDSLAPFTFEFKGTEVYAKTTPSGRTLINARFGPRNPTVGIIENGLPNKIVWSTRMPALPPALGLSLREVLNHNFAAFRGGYVREATLRMLKFKWQCVVMLLPRYGTGWGKVTLSYRNGVPHTEVVPASKYGSLFIEQAAGHTEIHG